MDGKSNPAFGFQRIGSKDALLLLFSLRKVNKHTFPILQLDQIRSNSLVGKLPIDLFIYLSQSLKQVKGLLIGTIGLIKQ